MKYFYDVKKYSIVLDDHVLFAESFSKLLENTGYFQSVLYFSSSDETLSYLHSYHTNNKISDHPFYLFLDYHLKEKTILPIINDLRRICKNSKIIIVSSSGNISTIKNLLDFNVDAILHKSCSLQEVISCLHQLDEDKKYYSLEIQSVLNSIQISEHSDKKLTSRELEILEYFSEGLTVDETAKKMFLSRHTVAAHRRKIFLKTGSNNIAELLNYARKKALI